MAYHIPFGADTPFGIAELLQMLALGRRSCVLTLTGAGGGAELRLRGGRLVAGDLLPPVATRDIGALPRQALVAARRADLQRALGAVLGWERGTVAFSRPAAAEDADPSFDVDAMLLETVLALDEWREASRLPALAARPRRTEGDAGRAVVDLTALERLVLDRCDGRGSLGEIARYLHASELDVARAAARLGALGMLQTLATARGGEAGTPAAPRPEPRGWRALRARLVGRESAA